MATCERSSLAGGDGSAAFPDCCVHELVEAQVARTPAAIAVEFEGHELTYLELNRRADDLARRLVRLGVGPEVIVGLCQHRSVEMMVGLLGILKAGAAYLPLDPQYPQERMVYMLRDSGARTIVTERELVGRFDGQDPDLVCLETAGDDWRNAPEPGGLPGVTPGNLAYILYTSGSTGQPKGVAMGHRAITNLIWWQLANSRLGTGARTLQLASISFDVSIQEIFATWCAGGRLVLINEALRRDPLNLVRVIGMRQIERIFLPFSSLQQLAECAATESNATPALREIMTAGEQLRITPQIAEWLRRIPECKLYNQYGPTESHVVVTNFPLDSSMLAAHRLPPIGKPIANVRIHILDSDLRPVRAGDAGEICIGGVCLARGYWRRPELTAARFVDDPFDTRTTGRLYRSGDLGRILPDGNIEFLGRLDDQVKIRGFRIELGEVEAALQDHPKVAQTVVLVREENASDRRLVAYIVPAPGQAVTTSELRTHLLGKLPDYMVPASFVAVSKIPVTTNGKVDRTALPAPSAARPLLSTEYAAPRTSMERAVAKGWGELLALTDVGIHDDFFELGGNSLSVMRFLARARRDWGAEIAVKAFFESPTVAAIAECIERCGADARTARAALPVPAHSLRRGLLPLSSPQEELWVASQQRPELPVYNEPFAIRLTGAVDAASMQSALDALARRHEILRTAFDTLDGRPVQRILDELHVPLEEIALGAKGDAAPAARMRVEALTRMTFDLSKPPLLRAVLVRSNGDGDWLHLVMHHLIIDAIGFYRVLIPDLWALYTAAREGCAATLPALTLQYSDYVQWQRSRLRHSEVARNIQYWTEHLKDLPRCELPVDRPRRAKRSGRGGMHIHTLPARLEAQLAAVGQRCSATLYMTIYAAFAALLARYTGLRIVVGTQEGGRDRAEFDALLGYFVRALIMRTDVCGDPTFVQLLERVRAELLAAYQHREYSLFAVLEELNRQQAAPQQALYQIAFVMEPEWTPHPAGWTVSQYEVHSGTAKFDLTLQVELTSDGIVCAFEYDSDLFEAETIRRMAGHFENLLNGVVANPGSRLSALPMLSAAEREQLLVTWNVTAVDYLREMTLSQLFEAQALHAPEAVALESQEGVLSYSELNARANRIAHALRSLGVGPEVLVGVCLERSITLVVGILGIVKAGGAYVPLDPAYPAARLAYMLQDTAAPVVLTSETLHAQLPKCGARVVCLDGDGATWVAGHAQTDLTPTATAENLAYVIYTSGSTGRPKGVMVTHRNVARLVCGASYASFSARETFLLLAPAAFDASTFELWGALLHGARLVIYPEETPTAAGLEAVIARYGVTTAWLTAGLFNVVVDERPTALRGLRQLLTGGEALSVPHVRRALANLPDVQLTNGYGPTEGTTFACCYRLPRELPDDWGSVPIGRPIANTEAYVLDETLQPVPIGVVGDLYIGGDGLARGYLNHPYLTATRFVTNPFRRGVGAKLYRTGDRVRYRADGNLEFLGRLDHQVKLRGYRIELGEIESALMAEPGVQQSCVVLREDEPGMKRLVGYAVGDGSRLDGASLRGRLKQQLPQYMVPSDVVVLPALPLTANGKIDRASLPAPAQHHGTQGGRVPPRNAVEVQLMRIWEEVLGLKDGEVGMRDNFFALGGHSLAALRTLDKIARIFNRQLPLDTFWYEDGTIEHLAHRLTNRNDVPLWSAPVPIKANGVRRALFCPHIVGGHLFFYDVLARHLSDDQPVYGLPARGVDGSVAPDTDIEAMATYCIDNMRKVQPFGPYRLMGYCSGGAIAFEMARQLRTRGEQVEFLALLDADAPGFYLLELLQTAWQLLRLANIRLVQQRLYRFVLQNLGLSHLRKFQTVTEAHFWAYLGYKRQPYPGRAHIFSPTEGPRWRGADLGWGRLITGGMTIHPIPGRHGDMVTERSVATLAEELGTCLAQLD
jgi:amino acid adenylation domain-containing protein